MPLKLEREGKIWYVRGSLNKIRVRESTRTHKRELAEAYLRQVQKDIEDRVYNSKKTVSEAIAVYIEKGGERRYLGLINERFGELGLTDVTPEIVSRYALETFAHMKASSIRRQFYTPLNAVMRAAHDAGMCPLVRFKPPKVEKIMMNFANAEWLRTFHANAWPQISIFVLFISSTAARVSEACNLTLRDIDFERGYVILRMTKNGSGRSISVPQNLLSYIAQWVEMENARRRNMKKGAQAEIAMDEPIFCYSGRWSVNQAIERVCDRVNIAMGALAMEGDKKVWLTEPAFPYYSSHKVGRHAFAARLLAEGKSLKFVAEAGGWKSIQIVSENYGHLERSAVDDRLRESTEAMVADMGQGSRLGRSGNRHRLGSNLTNDASDDDLVNAARRRISLISKDGNGGRCRD